MAEVTSHEAEQPTLNRVIGPALLLLFVIGDILGTGVYALTGKVATEFGLTMMSVRPVGANVPEVPITWTSTIASTSLGFATSRVEDVRVVGRPDSVTLVSGVAVDGSHSTAVLPTEPGAKRSTAVTATRPRVARTLTARLPTAGAVRARSITRVLRDLLLPGFLRRAARESQEWMYGYRIDWDERSTLDRQAA